MPAKAMICAESPPWGCSPAHERKARAQFQQEFDDVFDQGVLDFTLLRLAAQAEEVEAIGVFE